ncbi:MAG: DEAD/DEAH box helicase [Desulfobacteraceae bacterium]|nr:DEAD/DEAH box helicase [Desulfobacteraceae bacterium]MCB9495092.1 DEAD/DEAH box helicase [Desulfobacteraceae bacterium]
MIFENYQINTVLKKNLADQGLKRPTDIQYKAIPSILNDEDVLAIAQTGTGKTLAFAIPVIHKTIQAKTQRKQKGIHAIVMVPTRELAAQIHGVFSALCKNTRVIPLGIYGGVEQDFQINQLQTGVDILIATPGRMFDLISQKAIDVNNVRILVLDEADQMLDRGFLYDIQSIKRHLKQRHQTLFFSATINKDIKKLAFSQVKSTAIRIQISPNDPVSKNISHYVIDVEMDDKRFFLRSFIRDHENARIMVFVRTTVRADRVAKALERGGITALTIHGKKDQTERLAVMEAFKSGSENILIATDVSARGIDIPNVDYVINYDLPDQKEVYVHRVGRTGRGRSKGTAISFCSMGEKELLSEIENFITKPVEKIHITKNDYSFTVEVSDAHQDIQDMIRANEEWNKNRRKKRSNRKKKQ